jgi:hypothetical protein
VTRDQTISEAQPRPTGAPAWDDALNVVSRLEAAHERLASETAPTPALASNPPATLGTVEPDELARAIADIEVASEALRRAQPALETAQDRPTASTQVSGPHSVWLLIGLVWVSTVVVTAGVIYTIASLVG